LLHQQFDDKLVQACTSLYKPVQDKKATSKKAKQVLSDFSQVCFQLFSTSLTQADKSDQNLKININ
jgi:hypothetical protein